MTMPQQRPRVIVVDDDHALSQVIVQHIAAQGMDAWKATTGAELDAALQQHKPDLVLLDLMLKQEDGLDILRSLRRGSDIPVIIMTGHRRDEIDRVVGLELGADDYLPKPFGLHELTARIRAVLRRHATPGSSTPREVEGTSYRFGRWKFDIESRSLLSGDEPPIPLTKGEFALLRAFVDAPGRMLSREHLLRATRVHDDVFDRSIDVQILRLRRKLECDPANPELIVTQRGMGYVFKPKVQMIQ